MSTYPRVSVLMPIYNGEKYLRQAIDSILRQTFTDFEFLIINDGSTDSSAELIESYNDPRIRLVHNKTNLKLIETLNKGIKLARGQYIARMDCDDISLPERLAKQVAFMDAHPEVGVLGTGFYFMGSDGKLSYKVLFPIKHHLLRWGLCFYCPICHPSVLMRKDAIVKVDGYDPEMFHVEDYDLWYRLSKKTKLANLSDILLYLRKHQDSVCSTNLLLHTENATEINRTIISEVLGEDIDTYIIQCIRNRKFKSWGDQFRSVQLIERLRKSFVANKILSPEEIQLVNIDAANRIVIIAIPRIFDIRSLRLLISALHLDKLVMLRLLRLLFLRYFPSILFRISQKMKIVIINLNSAK